ncbi:MAG: hypothetical protein UZ21_OP11001000333 [Microgenomates bacterium OLB22]|nr:MAG: hypothetical protein UZ21_OP11001000333 [Microgenomates bacterium OLB22]
MTESGTEGAILIDMGQDRVGVEEAVLRAVRAIREQQGESMDPFLEGLVRSGIHAQRVEDSTSGVMDSVVDMILEETSRDGKSPEETEAFQAYIARWRRD